MELTPVDPSDEPPPVTTGADTVYEQFREAILHSDLIWAVARSPCLNPGNRPQNRRGGEELPPPRN